MHWSLHHFWSICFEQISKECFPHQLWSVLTDNILHLIVYYLLTFTFFTQCLKGVLVSLYLFSVKPEDVQLTTNVTANKACLNDVVFFNCSAANANPPVALYQFFENDVLFGSSSSGVFSKMVMNSGNLTYKCVANNTAGATSSQNVSITVNGEANNDYIKKWDVFCFLSCLLVFVSSLLVIVYHFLPGVSRASRVACAG